MKKIMKTINKIGSKLFILFLLTLYSCSQSNDSQTSNSNLIIGKWAWQTLPDKCASYREFKSNGTLTYYQNVCGTPQIDYLLYKIEGNILNTKNADTSIKGENNKTETIIELTDKIMTTTFVDNYLGIQTRTYTKIP